MFSIAGGQYVHIGAHGGAYPAWRKQIHIEVHGAAVGTILIDGGPQSVALTRSPQSTDFTVDDSGNGIDLDLRSCGSESGP